MINLIYGIAICLLGIVSIYNLWNNVTCYSQFRSFNENVANWSKEIDSSVRQSIILQSMDILREVDERINKINEEKNEEDDGNESLQFDEPC